MELLNFIKENRIDWQEKLISKPYCLKVARDGDYYLLKYNMLESDLNLKLVQEARGAIFYIKDEVVECVCYPFKKFFNYSEAPAAHIDWTSAAVYEKIDGSLMKMWYHNDQWHLSTNGTIDAFKAETGMFNTFGSLFEEIVYSNIQDFGRYLDKDYCYMFELVHPDTRIVIEYEPAVYLLGRRHMTSFKEDNSILSNVDIPFVKHIKRYNLSNLTKCIEFAMTMSKDEEGFVVCDKYFNRIKIKSPEYLIAHRCANNGVITTKRILNMIKDLSMDDFIAYAPHHQGIVDNIRTVLLDMCFDLTQIWCGRRLYSLYDKKALSIETEDCSPWMRCYFFKKFENKDLNAFDYLLTIPTKTLAKLVEERFV